MKRPLIDIIATGSTTSPESLETAVHFLDQLGFDTRFSDIFFDNHPLYICGDDQRFLNLKDALYAEDSAFIWCLRGGSGTSRLLPKLVNLNSPERQIPLMGFSDVTALHLFLTQTWGWKSIHGPTLNSFATQEKTKSVGAHILDLLHHKKTKVCVLLTPIKKEWLTFPLTAPICGGNLALLQRSIGTPWQLDARGKILFFEDINEAAYRVAEMLDQLKHAGLLQDVKAILFGDFSHEKPEKNDEKLLDHVIQDFSKSMSCPVFKDFPVGHMTNNHPVQLGAPATLFQDGAHIFYEQEIRL